MQKNQTFNEKKQIYRKLNIYLQNQNQLYTQISLNSTENSLTQFRTPQHSKQFEVRKNIRATSFYTQPEETIHSENQDGSVQYNRTDMNFRVQTEYSDQLNKEVNPTIPTNPASIINKSYHINDFEAQKLDNIATTQRPSSTTRRSQRRGGFVSSKYKSSPDQFMGRKFLDLDKFFNKTHKNYPLLKILNAIQFDIIEALNASEFQLMVKHLTCYFETCQDCQELGGFCKMLKFLSQFALHCNYVDTASFLYSQVLIIAELTRNYKLKIQSLMGLANCSQQQYIHFTRFKIYDYQLMFLRKALVYAWKVNDVKREILLYDLIGLGYFYQGNIEKAREYHGKFLRGEVEPTNSFLRETSQKYIKYFEQRQTYFTTEFSKIMMIKLSLPINNRFDYLKEISTDEDVELCDLLRYRNLYNCDGKLLLRNTINSYEFKELDFDQFSLGFKDRFRKSLVTKFKLRNLLITSTDEFTMQQRLTRINRQNRRQGIDNDRSFEAAMQRVKQGVDSERQPYGEPQGQIYMSHLTNQSRDKDIVQKKYLRRCFRFFQRLGIFLQK